MSSGVSVIGLVRNIGVRRDDRRYSVQVRKGRKESPRFMPASQATLCLVVARGETSRDATRRGLLNRGNDSRLLGFFFRHGHGHHGDAATDGDARADETRQREDGHGHVHSLTARHLDFSFVMCSSFSLFVLFFIASSTKSSVKPLHSFIQKHPPIHQSVCPYEDELNPTPQDARASSSSTPPHGPSSRPTARFATTHRAPNVPKPTHTISSRAFPPSFAPTVSRKPRSAHSNATRGILSSFADIAAR